MIHDETPIQVAELPTASISTGSAVGLLYWWSLDQALPVACGVFNEIWKSLGKTFTSKYNIAIVMSSTSAGEAVSWPAGEIDEWCYHNLISKNLESFLLVPK